MRNPSFVAIARMMIRRHGLRAQAVAMERAAETRLQGDAAGLNHWQSTGAAIRELRRTAASHQAAAGEATA
jgi:hypothetical protein